MNKRGKSGRTMVGLIGAGAVLWLWCFRDRGPTNNFSADGGSPAPITAVFTGAPGEPSALARSPVEIPLPQARGPNASPGLAAEIAAALAAADAVEWERVLNELFPSLLAADRAAAVRLVENLRAGDQRGLLLRRLARSWAAADFSGAVTWISGLTDFSEQKAAFEEACLAAAELDPAEAAHAWEAADFKEDGQVLGNLVQNWARHDLAAAQEWVLARPRGVQRDHAVARFAFVLSQTKPIEAATLIVRELPEGPVQTEAVVSILHQWTRTDLVGATAWVARFPAGPLADRARGEISAR